MRVLVLGAGGFIGARIVACLLSRGHAVTCAGRFPTILLRKFPTCQVVAADLLLDDRPTWLSRLVGIDAVVNAAGVLRGDLEGVHSRGAVVLFAACAEAGIGRVLQLSALGAGEQPELRFLATKHAADECLMRLARDLGQTGWCVLKPSLVIGRGGASTALFCSLAVLPRPIRLGPGLWRVQPIHIADLARAVADLLEGGPVPPRLEMVGPEAMTTDGLTLTLRAWLGRPPARPLTVPETALKIAARLGDAFPLSSLTSESLSMLAAGNTGDPAPMARVLGWSPRPLAEALAAEPAGRADMWHARLLPMRGLLVAALLAVWVGSGAVSFLVPAAQSDMLLSGLGLGGRAAIAVTWAGASVDVALGLALLSSRWRRRAAMAQLAIMALYTVLASVALPGLWLDPFGPLLKNFAVLAAILAFLAIED